LFEDFESFGNTGNPKGMNLASVIERKGLRSPLMVGDADGDEAAARFCNVPFAYVSYGFGQALEPDYTFESFGQLTTTFT
jgi:phosphoglycolate phosphatase